MEVLSICPLLLPVNRELTAFTGYIAVRGHQFQVEVKLRAPGVLVGASVRCEWKLHHLLANHTQLLQQRLQQSGSLRAFLVELQTMIDRQLTQGCTNIQPPPLKPYYERLIQEIEQLGWDKLAYIDSAFEELHLETRDAASRGHVIKVIIHQEHPDVAPTCNAQLPVRFELVWSPKCTIGSVLKQFEHAVSLHQDFWDMLDEIDRETWILEPENPARGAPYRRLALGSNASLQINVDPSYPRMLPECRFLGADHVVNPLRQKLNANLHRWNPDESLLTNFQSTLGISFPSPADTTKEEMSVECGICYAYRLDGLIPDQVCDDSRCNQPFHQACLYEWLRALPSSRQSFNLIFGECPYCNKPITVKMLTR